MPLHPFNNPYSSNGNWFMDRRNDDNSITVWKMDLSGKEPKWNFHMRISDFQTFYTPDSN